jgi:dinuclear metal center YbgI/SA1388 family protein
MGAMTVEELDAYFRSILPIEDLEKSDSSLNGIQVGDKSREVEKIVFAVDACMRVFEAAQAAGGDCIVVHHGLFWGKPIPITDTHFSRVKYLIDHGTALYAVHLPLDMHPVFGNNAALARMLGLTGLEEFGRYKGFAIGLRGTLPEPMGMDEILRKIGLDRGDCLSILPFGPEKIASAAVISGGATHEIAQAVDAGVDLYLTGEASHVMYHQALEGKINIIAGGHYNTEIVGVKLLAEKCFADTGIQTEFIDAPTGL